MVRLSPAPRAGVMPPTTAGGRAAWRVAEEPAGNRCGAGTAGAAWGLGGSPASRQAGGRTGKGLAEGRTAGRPSPSASVPSGALGAPAQAVGATDTSWVPGPASSCPSAPWKLPGVGGCLPAPRRGTSARPKGGGGGRECPGLTAGRARGPWRRGRRGRRWGGERPQERAGKPAGRLCRFCAQRHTTPVTQRPPGTHPACAGATLER